MDRNREKHGQVFSEHTGEVSIYTQEYRTLDPTEPFDAHEWESEIVIHCLEERQLEMIRVVGPDGNTYRLNRGEGS